MVSLTALWLPILLSAVIVFIASHKNDYRKLPDEEKVLDALRSAGVTPGRWYIFPFCTHKEMKAPEVLEKFKHGPVGALTIKPSGTPAMGKFLGQWFVYCIVISIFTAT